MITELEMGKAESELELGLGLSLGGGTASKIVKPGGGGAWGERGRLLTAKDFPSVGSKRAADSASYAGASPPRSSQVVGWPPIGSHRMNSLVNNQATKSPKEEEEDGKKKAKDDETKDVTKKVNGKVQVGFIKVNMDGVAIGRKVDLNAHSSYENLAHTLEDMFFRTSPGTIGLTGQFTKPLRLLDGSSEFVLTYEDKEGDWMLVGDVPWRMFITSVKRLRVMKTSEANGLAARHQDPKERQRNKPV
ncbi:hypothetical protein HID58_051855 [Brassica napus]|uniref:Auxin-responsive protein n=4 Tax=Brassica TaxID=3705 RepID=A0A816I6W8_BRANA|nr:PREDICTED: auxin-responsive protein IAA13-like [Brassica oleracea var. oleracea]XP_013683452.1 auxin-responsive protein IAA13 [Brassica napus]KAF3507357.1 hypothetical protein F2Q69_00001565 [Brassica cretica]KAG2296648.1 hypothetical protein Bca52824_043317 [Brassica carinata]KAH0889426.1 hypothetical protein HID58_051855 [Brassica napus]CAF1699849.1 unnamed protein product [Brassica napus]